MRRPRHAGGLSASVCRCLILGPISATVIPCLFWPGIPDFSGPVPPNRTSRAQFVSAYRSRCTYPPCARVCMVSNDCKPRNPAALCLAPRHVTEKMPREEVRLNRPHGASLALFVQVAQCCAAGPSLNSSCTWSAYPRVGPGCQRGLQGVSDQSCCILLVFIVASHRVTDSTRSGAETTSSVQALFQSNIRPVFAHTCLYSAVSLSSVYPVAFTSAQPSCSQPPPP